MAKFCSNCGKELKNGKPCDCKKMEITDNETVNNIINLINDMSVFPIDTIKSFIKNRNFNFALILVAIMSVVCGLFSISLINNSGYEAAGSLVYNLVVSNIININVPYLKVFFTVIAVIFCLSFVFSAVLYFVNNSIFKGNASYREIYALYGIISLINSSVLFIATILLFMSMSLGLIVVVFGIILSSIYTYHAIKFIGPKDENKYGYIFLITLILFYVVTVVLSKMFI